MAMECFIWLAELANLNRFLHNVHQEHYQLRNIVFVDMWLDHISRQFFFRLYTYCIGVICSLGKYLFQLFIYFTVNKSPIDDIDLCGYAVFSCIYG